MACQLDEKASRSKAHRSRLYQTCSASLANTEFSRRLLEGKDWFEDARAESRARDLLDYLTPSGSKKGTVQPQETRTEETSVVGQRPQARPRLTFLRYQSPPRKEKDPNQKTGGHQAPVPGKHSPPARTAGAPRPAAPTAVPLTLQQVALTHRVVEAKSASRYWTNYVA